MTLYDLMSWSDWFFFPGD